MLLPLEIVFYERLQENLHKYLTEEKLDVLGNPIPRNEKEIDWNSEDFSFEFDLYHAKGVIVSQG